MDEDPIKSAQSAKTTALQQPMTRTQYYNVMFRRKKKLRRITVAVVF